MEKLTAEKYVERSQKLYQASMDVNYKRWHDASLEGYQFGIGIQQNDELLKKLKGKGMPTFIINRMTPIKEMIKYFVTANSPQWQAVGVEASDAAIGDMHNAVGERSWYLSHGKSIFSNVIDDALMKSLGWFHVKVDANLDKGAGEVTYDKENPWCVFVDPMAKDIMFRDANWMLIKDDLPRGSLLGMYHEKEFLEKIKNASSNDMLYQNYFNYMGIDSRLWEETNEKFPVSEVEPTRVAYNNEGEEDDILPHARLYTKEREKMTNVTFVQPPTDDVIEQINATVKEKTDKYNAEMDVKFLEEKQKIDQALSEKAIIQERHALEMQNLKDAIAIAKRTYTEQLATQLINDATRQYTQTFNEDQYAEYKKKKTLQKYQVDETYYYEDVIYLTITVGDQHLSTKRMPSKFFPLIPIPYIFTGNTFPMSLMQLLMGKQKEMNKAHQIMIHNANLGSNVRWIAKKGSVDKDEWENYGSSAGSVLFYNPGADPPKEVLPMPLSNAFHGIVDTGKEDFEFLSGVFRSSMGDAGAMHDTAKGLQRADQFGTRRTMQWVDNIVDPALEQLGKVFKDYAQALYKSHKIAQYYDSHNKKHSLELNIPVYNGKGDIIKYYNDYKSAEFDVKIVSRSTLPTNQEDKFNKMMALYREKIVPRKTVIRESPDIPDKEELIKEWGEIEMLSAENEQMKKELTKVRGDMQSLEHMVVTSRIGSTVAGITAKLETSLAQSKARMDKGTFKVESELRNLLNQFTSELDDRLKGAVAEVKQKAEAQEKKKSKEDKPKKPTDEESKSKEDK